MSASGQSPEPTPQIAVVLGDQLTLDNPALRALDRRRDAVLMVEAADEASYVPQHKQRLTLFFAAMRHHAARLEKRGYRVIYSRLGERGKRRRLADEVVRLARRARAQRLHTTEPGDYRVHSGLTAAARELGVPLETHADTHFMVSRPEFEQFAGGHRSLVLENFYRQQRRRHAVLMHDGKPRGARWNFDADNRGRLRPGAAPRARLRAFSPDAVTRQVMDMVARQFAHHPGRLDAFDYPVTAAQARSALRDFVRHRLADFGTYQDAMAIGQPYLYHSRLSSSLNLHLLDPRDAIEAAVAALDDGGAPLNAVEGFVRQILGWREFVRGVYWLKMPSYAEMNVLGADGALPAFMWTGETEMVCVRECVGQLVEHAYAHHIQRLMVLGLFGLLLGVRPYLIHEWHMAMYIDAVDWVSLPNVLGMSQFADGGVVGTKPYCASGAYIQRMSDYCSACRYDPRRATGDNACPMTTLYWDFLARHRTRFKDNRRMGFQLANLERKPRSEITSVRRHAERIRVTLTAGRCVT